MHPPEDDELPPEKNLPAQLLLRRMGGKVASLLGKGSMNLLDSSCITHGKDSLWGR
jgi:hypothetical protein